MVHAKHGVILVEDDGGMRRALTRMLTGAGYTVHAFESAEALLDVGAGAPPWGGSGCVICDVRLPGASGFELHRRIAEQGLTPPWIFITAHDDPMVRDQAARAGAAFLLKPFEGRALLDLVAHMAGRP